MRQLKRLFAFLLLVIPFIAEAHIGSPGVLFEGMAGKYKVIVNVSPPDVIPGTAQVNVLVESGIASEITIVPVYLYAGAEGAPKADVATPVPTIPGKYQGLIWLMENGVASVRVIIHGDQGVGEAVVPIMAVPTAQRDMPPNLGWLLAGLGLFLVVLMITIIGASVSDGVTAPAHEVSAIRKRKRWLSMAVTTVVLGLILFGGSSWWNSWAEDYKRYMYKPFTASSKLIDENGSKALMFRIDSASLEGRWMSYLIPDHGKLMHMFLVRDGSLDIFAHLHPQRTDSVTFETPLPALPGGRYLIFADVVRRGFASTIVDTLDIDHPFPGTMSGLNKDDSYLFSNAVAGKKALIDSAITVCGVPGVKTLLADGSSMTLENAAGKYKSGEISKLTFMVADPKGNPAQLEPYLGMGGHAVVLKNDAKVYIHLHPTGTFSSAAAQMMESRIEKKTGYIHQPNAKQFKDSIDVLINKLDNMTESERNEYLMKEMGMNPSDPSHKLHEGAVVDFPYVFPLAGDYRIWVQVKRAGKVLSAAFDVNVQ